MPLSVSATFDSVEFITATVVEVNSIGGPVAGFSSPPVWTIDNAAVANIVPSPDGSSCGITALAPGTATVTCTVGSFPPAIVAITVVPAVGVGLSISVTPPQEQVPA